MAKRKRKPKTSPFRAVLILITGFLTVLFFVGGASQGVDAGSAIVIGSMFAAVPFVLFLSLFVTRAI